MKIPRLLSLCAVLGVLVLSALLSGCSGCGKPSDRAPVSDGSDLTAPSKPLSPWEETTVEPAEQIYDPSLYVVIATAEDLMAFHRAVNRDGFRFNGMTVIFLDDVDMRDYTWTPLDGGKLVGVTFDGQGHTLSGLRFADYEYPLDAEPANADKGCGLIDVAEGDLFFRDLTLADSRVTAYDRSVGLFIGSIKQGLVRFENCHAVDFTAEGWMDWFHSDRTSGGHAVAMRLGGFVGYVDREGRVAFADCSVEGLTLSGFHHLAGFVGYDGSGTLDASCFSNCTVKGAEITFSYCLAEGYSVDQPQKFVSVFFNARDWADTTALCTAAENRYSDVFFYDWADNNSAYTPENFTSSRTETSP